MAWYQMGDKPLHAPWWPTLHKHIYIIRTQCVNSLAPQRFGCNIKLIVFTFISHYNDVIMSTMASQITSISIVCSTVGLDADENIKVSRHWPLCGEFTSDRWIPHTKGQWCRKCFHLMTSSWRINILSISCEIALRWWPVTIGSDVGMVPSGNKPLPDPMTQIYVTIWHHQATMSWREINQCLILWIN